MPARWLGLLPEVVQFDIATPGGSEGTPPPTVGEAEASRRQRLAAAGEITEAPDDLDSLLDRAYLAGQVFDEHILDHPACLQSPELYRAALLVSEALGGFYMAVGQEAGKDHIPTETTAAG